MIYEAADKAIKSMNRRNQKLFSKLRLAKFDELHVIRAVGEAYDDSMRYAEQQYQQVAQEAYIAAQLKAGISRGQAVKNARKIDRDWILDMLEEYDLVTLYRFDTETERKKQRLVEALVAAHNKNAEIEKALRYWTLQLAQYADNAVDRATILAFKDAGVKYLRWNTERDDRVCEVCEELDGKVFPIEKYPPKQHFRCRCWPSPVLN